MPEPKGLRAWLCRGFGPDPAPPRPPSPQPGITMPRRTPQETQPCAQTSKAFTLSSASFVALPKPELRKKHKAASVEGEIGLREGSPAEETARLQQLGGPHRSGWPRGPV